MSKSTKPVLRPVAKPAPAEEERLQVARYLANEKKTYFQIILANIIQNPAFVKITQGWKMDGTNTMDVSVRAAIDAAIDGADYAIEKLYPVEKKED